jgi:hypothetical protein
MTEPILSNTLTAYAQHAGSMRPDMLAMVEQGYRRRRRRQKAGSAAAGLAVVAVIAVVAAVHPFRSTGSVPLPPAASVGVTAPSAPSSPMPTSPRPSTSAARTVLQPLKCPIVSGTPESAPEVLAQLTAASQVNEYQAAHVDPTTMDSRLHGVLPDVHVPLPMLKALAADVSSWTSTCISNDSLAYGTMQVSQAVNDQMNERFQTTLDRLQPADNIALGTAYLEYLTVHFGIVHFHNDFDLTTNIPLRDAVLAAYDVGMGAVETSGTIHIGPIGQQFVTTVVGLMKPANEVQKVWGR